MTMHFLTQYFIQYGPIFIFLIVLLEYMNFPGLAGSWILYFLGRLGGKAFFRVYTNKFPKQKETIEKNLTFLREKGAFGVFISKLLPMVRTLISIPAGMVSMNFWKYTVSSFLGVMVWNLVFVGAGYLMGDAVWNFFV